VSVGDNSEVASRAQLVDTQALELSDAELENVSGGFLDNLAAKCEISGGLNLLSSNVAIELG
jgi:bacteriocin-like protein